jgi:hypothetical protein
MAAYAFADVTGDKGTVTVFICNQCPYVKAVIDRLVANPRGTDGRGHRLRRHATDYCED